MGIILFIKYFYYYYFPHFGTVIDDLENKNPKCVCIFFILMHFVYNTHPKDGCEYFYLPKTALALNSLHSSLDH